MNDKRLILLRFEAKNLLADLRRVYDEINQLQPAQPEQTVPHRLRRSVISPELYMPGRDKLA